ncbi:MAG TPA: DUF268 domain-containing protein [Candidatus Paceibacterota bacterium]
MIKRLTHTIASRTYWTFKNYFAYKRYVQSYLRFKGRLDAKRGFVLAFRDRIPVLNEDTSQTNFDTHYIYHPAWAARIVRKINPHTHVDIASTLTFSSILSAFVPTEFYDLRPASLTLSGLRSGAASLSALPFADNSIESLSCMHTIEHVGLGRYGDPLDPDGDLTAIHELRRVLSPGGSLLFVVPIGTPKISFNAHRVYSYAQIMQYFDGLQLQEFTLIPDNALTVGMIEHATKEQADAQTYGCGCFWFVKP